MHNRFPERMLEYYQASHNAYHNWGKDLERPDLYALHCGYTVAGVEKAHYEEILEYNRRFIKFSNISDQQEVFDAGCGTGVLSYFIGTLFPQTHVTGINLSELQLSVAQKLKDRGVFDNVTFSIQNYMETAFQNSHFNRAIFCESFSHALDKSAVLIEVNRIIQKDGVVSFSDPFISDENTSNKQQHQIEQVENGFRLAPFISIQEMNNLLANHGFRDIVQVDITENVLPSVHLMARNAEMRIKEGKQTPEIITVSRYGCMALGKLFDNESMKYYFIKAKK